jgi:hypothetical protein
MKMSDSRIIAWPQITDDISAAFRGEEAAERRVSNFKRFAALNATVSRNTRVQFTSPPRNPTAFLLGATSHLQHHLTLLCPCLLPPLSPGGAHRPRAWHHAPPHPNRNAQGHGKVHPGQPGDPSYPRYPRCTCCCCCHCCRRCWRRRYITCQKLIDSVFALPQIRVKVPRWTRICEGKGTEGATSGSGSSGAPDSVDPPKYATDPLRDAGLNPPFLCKCDRVSAPDDGWRNHQMNWHSKIRSRARLLQGELRSSDSPSLSPSLPLRLSLPLPPSPSLSLSLSPSLSPSLLASIHLSPSPAPSLFHSLSLSLLCFARLLAHRRADTITPT